MPDTPQWNERLGPDWGIADWGERPTRILVVGTGDIGARVLHELARARHPRVLSLLGRDQRRVSSLANLVRHCALQCERPSQVREAVADLRDTDQCAAAIAAFGPDIIFAAASRQSWHVITELPVDAYERIDSAGFGPWLPMHLDPVVALMRSVRAAACTAIVVNAAFPDAVHPAVAAAGLSPHVGIGNVANPVPGLRLVAARRLGCDAGQVQARLVAHHYVSHRVPRHGDTGGAPVSLTFHRGGHDVTGEVGPAAAFAELAREQCRPGGKAGHAMTAASALSLLEPLADGTSARTHAPGLDARPGGYPVRVAGRRVMLDLPDGVSEPEAVAINEAGQRHDGIERIDPDGRVWFTEAATSVLRDELGYSCESLHWTEAQGYADELAARYAAYRDRVRR